MREEDNTAGLAERTSVKMWPGILSGIIIGLIAFILSFDALRLVFVACGINPYLSWGGPVCVDGTILLCTWATWGFKKGHIRGSWYPWAGLVLFSGFSIGGNALHAIINTGYELPGWVPPVIMSIPPVAMLYATHLIVIIAGDRLDKTNTILDTVEPEPEPVRAERVEERPAVPPTPPSFTPASGPEPVEPAMPVLPDLSDWRITVPDMEADVHPKAFEAEPASAAEASTPTTIQTIVPSVVEENTDDVMPASSMPVETDSMPASEAHAVDGPDDRGPVAETRIQPEPEEAEPVVETAVEAAAAGEPVTDGSVPDIKEPQSHAKAEDPAERPASRRRAADDDEWNAWLDRLEAEGGTASAAMAVKEGLASSLSTAKRHLARIRRQRAERS